MEKSVKEVNFEFWNNTSGNSMEELLMRKKLELIVNWAKNGKVQLTTAELEKLNSSEVYEKFKILDSIKLPIEIELELTQELIKIKEMKNSTEKKYGEKVKFFKSIRRNTVSGADVIPESIFIQGLIKYEMEKLQQFYDKFIKDAVVDLNDEKSIKNYMEDCIIFKEQYLKIHPFNDKNGRTSRILFNVLLIKKGIKPIVPYENYISRKEADTAEQKSNSGNYDDLFKYYANRIFGDKSAGSCYEK